MVCRHKKGTWEGSRKEKDQGKREGCSAKASPQTRSSFLVHEYLGSERPISVEISVPTRLSPRGSHVRRKFRQRTTLRSESSTFKGHPLSESSTMKGLLYAGWNPAAIFIRSEEGRTIALERSVSEKADKDKRQSTFFFTNWVSFLIPTWAVLRSMANARKCQLEDFCEKKWETHAFCTRNMGAHVWFTSAKKLVSSNFAKMLEVATKIRETCEKTLFTPSSPVKLLNSIVSV